MSKDTDIKITLTPEDYKVDEPVKWCAGCGSHAVLATIKNALPETGVKKENIVFVSGIGCSSRFPYYINTYGFHSLHGRAAPLAAGIKIANPGLSVWIVTGDGDSMAIGGNHFIHIIRRNIDVNLLLFNNKIYGLTKGQYSPTTPKGSITKTSPEGTIENPFRPGELVMGSQGSFFARVVDTEPKMMKEVFIQAAKHKGTSVVEVLSNCVIFNNQVHSEITGKDVRKDNQIYLEHGKPENGITEKDLLIHDAHDPRNSTHYNLVRMTLPHFPVAMGIIRSVQSSVYEDLLYEQVNKARKNTTVKNMDELLKSGNVFHINGTEKGH